jgi:uncharacterized protein YraI
MKGTHLSLRTWPFLAALLLLMLIPVLTPVLAQEAVPTPITLGQTLPGEINATTTTPRFMLAIPSAQPVSVQVLAVTSGASLSFTVRDPDGVVIQSVVNPGAQAIIQSNANLTASGNYVIEVQSANNAPAQFAVSAQPGIPAPPANLLTVGQSVTATVDTQQTIQTYSFDSSQQEILLLTVKSDLPAFGPMVMLQDGVTGDILALSNLRLLGARYRIPIGISNYMLTVTQSGSAGLEPYTVCLETESGSVTCEGGAAATPTESASTACLVMASGGVSINVRTGPGVDFGILTALPAGAQAPVIGKLADGSWFQINFGGIIGWVSAPFVTATGDCGVVPAVVPPPAPTAGPTIAPTLAPTLAPTSAPTTAPTDAPTATNTPEPPTATATNSGGGGGVVVTLRPGILVTFSVDPGLQINPAVLTQLAPGVQPINPGG